MSTHYTYFLILLASLLGPLALSFDKKVAFCKSWKYVFPAMILPALFYIGWDMYFTAQGVWHFNPNYITGIYLYNLPMEEVLFFFIVPYCCVFIYACIRAYFPQWSNAVIGEKIFLLIAILLLVVGILFFNRAYTSWTFLLNAFFMFLIYFTRRKWKAFDITAFLISYLIILIPFLLVNGFLTAIPVVLYKDAENLGIRIYTIPLEDVFYGMLLIMMNIGLYERVQWKK